MSTSATEIQFDVKKIRTEPFDDLAIDSSLIDSPSPSEGPDKILDASLASFPPGYFDCLFGEKLMSNDAEEFL